MKTCQNCQALFVISDFEKIFLTKVSPEVNGKKYEIPLPEVCPDCRLANRTAHRNEQYYHPHKSLLSGEPVISLYAPNSPWSKNYKIYTHGQWWNDTWDGLDYGRDFDFSRPFFEQFHELCLEIPHVNVVQLNNENSPYSTGTAYCKNCYLINCSENAEDCYYGKLIQSSRDIMDSSYVYDSELCYECFYVKNCYNCKYVYNSQNCNECWLSDNLKGCSNCFLCTNLSNKQYHFMNQSLSKDEYEAKIKEFLGSKESVEKAKKNFEELRKKRIYKYATIINCENSTGDFLTNCKNVSDSYDVNDSLDCQYVTVGVNVKDLVDCSNMYLKPELNYQVLGTIGTYNVIFSLYIFHSQNVMYSEFCFNSQNLFGCSGLRNKKYCIFNKQYTKEQYEELVPRIIAHMQKTGEWGQYFPIQHSPFGYNESVAQEYLPLTKEQSLAKGYHWQEPDQKDYKAQTYKVPNKISEVKDEILQQILACRDCGRNYKIIPQELKRLRSMQFPIPEKCPDCRHMSRMKLRNSRKLWERKCAKCSAAIQSTFSSERPETVYCDKCYLETVY